MQHLLQAFLRALPQLPRRRSLLLVEGLRVSTRRLGRAELVVSRGLCRYSSFDLSRVPPDRRSAALALQLRHWSPYRESDHVVVWSPAGAASVWCWDRQFVDAQARDHGLEPADLLKVPEPLLMAPGSDGLRLVACLEGFEAQHWLRGRLLTSRWWPTVPSAAQWLAFERDCGPDGPQSGTVPEPQELALQPRPWARAEAAARSAGGFSLAEAGLYCLLCLALGVPAAWMAARQYRLHEARVALEAEAAQLAVSLQDILQARTQALEAAAQQKALLSLQVYASPLVQMGDLAQALSLAPGSVRVKEWEMAEGRLRVLFASAAGPVSGSEFVTAFEQAGHFDEVKIVTQPDPKELAFVMNLRPVLKPDATERDEPAPSQPRPR